MVGCQLINFKSNFMKKIIIVLFALSFLAYTGCRKRDTEEGVSKVVKASYPVITFTGSKFVSIPVGGTVPSIAATAYDSLLNEAATVAQGPSTVDVNTPGLYTQEFIAKNSNGYRTSGVAYVAVTNIAESEDLSGAYKCVGRNGIANVTELANGLYRSDNVGGNPTGPVTVYFVQLEHAVVKFPTQPTTAGTMGFTDVSVDPGVSYQYKVVNPGYGTGLRVFEKQ
jgi:hypothetical protein